ERGDPAAAHRLGEASVGQQRAPACAGRPELGDDAVAVCDEHRFAGRRQANVLAEPVFERLEADGSHGATVASGSYLVKPGAAEGASTAPSDRHALGLAERGDDRAAERGQVVRPAGGDVVAWYEPRRVHAFGGGGQLD